MKLNARETFLLWKLLEFPCHRYLLTFVRKQGYERAEQHIAISKVLWEAEFCKTALPEYHEQWMAVHNLIADKITDHLPRTIGFDIDSEENHDWDILTDRFFRKLVALDIKHALRGFPK